MAVMRFDTLPGLAPAKRTAAGFVRVQGFATRVGVFPYRRADGSIRRELRLPEEVFRADTLDALCAVPLTLNHPAGMVTPKNARSLTVGLVSNAQAHGDHVRVDINIIDETAIAAAEAGIKQLSVGYEVDLEETPGVWRGQHYDAIQRNITPNHLALVAQGRAGPDAKIRLDQLDGAAEACDEILSIEEPTKAEVKTMKIRLDDVEHDVTDAVGSGIEKMQARIDALADELKSANEKASPAALNAAVASRSKLLSDLRSVFGEADAARFDAVDDDNEIRKAIVGKLRPAIKLDGKSDSYIEGMFDVAMQARQDAVASRKNITTASTVAVKQQVEDTKTPNAIADATKRRLDRATKGEG